MNQIKQDGLYVIRLKRVLDRAYTRIYFSKYLYELEAIVENNSYYLCKEELNWLNKRINILRKEADI